MPEIAALAANCSQLNDCEDGWQGLIVKSNYFGGAGKRVFASIRDFGHCLIALVDPTNVGDCFEHGLVLIPKDRRDKFSASALLGALQSLEIASKERSLAQFTDVVEALRYRLRATGQSVAAYLHIKSVNWYLNRRLVDVFVEEPFPLDVMIFRMMLWLAIHRDQITATTGAGNTAEEL